MDKGNGWSDAAIVLVLTLLLISIALLLFGRDCKSQNHKLKLDFGVEYDYRLD